MPGVASHSRQVWVVVLQTGVVPPPEVHTIVRGEVVNLQDIEIGVHPLPSAAPAVPSASVDLSQRGHSVTLLLALLLAGAAVFAVVAVRFLRA